MTEFRSLVDQASDPALAIDNDSCVVGWNDQARALLGYEPEQAFGRHCYDILQATLPSGEPLCSPECVGKRCFLRHSPFSVHDCSVRRNDGQWLRASISSLAAPAPEKKGYESSAIAVIFLQARNQAAARDSPDRLLRISTLGRFGLSVADRGLPIDQWYRKHALTLLKLLVIHRGTAVHREHVIECLWPDADEHRGRERLKVTTYFLRQQMRSAGACGDVINVADASYSLRRNAVWLDCEMFESLFNEGRLLKQRGRAKDALSCFEKAEHLYNGDFLPEEQYADWCAGERERLREIYFDVLGHMVEAYLENGDHERAVQYCRLALSREPCRESFHRMLMIGLARLGRNDRVIEHYGRFRQVLKAELGADPAPETERLYRELVAADKTSSALARPRR